MTAIYKRELKSYFQSMTGYVLIAFLVIFTGIYFMAYNLNSGYPYFSYVLMNINYVLIIIIPMLTMRSFAEERKNKTDQLLLAAPVKLFDIVMGKYLAMATVFAVPDLLHFSIDHQELWNRISESRLSVDPDVLPAWMCIFGNRNVSFVTHGKPDHCSGNNIWGAASDLSVGRADQFPSDIGYKWYDRYCGTCYYCGTDHLPNDGKLDDGRNDRSDRSCCGCDYKLCEIFSV